MNQKRNLSGLTTVVLLHVALLAVFLHGSRLTVFKPVPPMVDLVPTLEPPPPKPRDLQVDEPRLQEPTIVVPRLLDEIPLTRAPELSTREASDVTPQAPAERRGGLADGAVKPQTHAAPVVVAAVVDAQACAKPDYPKNALRNGDTGTVVLAFLIGTDGRVADARVEKSSGFRELDRAAQAGLSLCKFKPGTVDGTPQQTWTKLQYVWSLD